MAVSIQVDSGRAVIALGKFRLGVRQNEELMSEIGASMLVSVRKTFREQGSPAGSWVPLSPNTIKRNPRVYSAGHKLLILSGMLLNSITYRVVQGAVEIGTALKYAAVHQFGSRDRSVAIGPQTKDESQNVVSVNGYSYRRQGATLGTGKMGGRKLRIQGPREGSRPIEVPTHTRHQNIPPRPYLVFRPEDPERMRRIAQAYIRRQAEAAGLAGAQ